jgi:hypothetical protein
MMKEMVQRLKTLQQSSTESLASFYEPHLYSFSVKPGASRLSVTSTCYSLQALLAMNQDVMLSQQISSSSSQLGINLGNMRVKIPPKAEDSQTQQQQQQTDNDDPRTPVGVILRELLLSEWRRDDLFQVPLLLYTVLTMDQEQNELSSSSSSLSVVKNTASSSFFECNVNDQEQQQLLASNVQSLITATLDARPRRRDGSEQHYSDYILFQCTQVYTRLYNRMQVQRELRNNNRNSNAPNPADSSSSLSSSPIAGLSAQAVPDGVTVQLSLALSRCAEVSLNQLCSQLALRSAGDSNSFDIMRLAYALLTCIVSTQALAGTAGRELAPGKGPSPGTRIGPVNRLLVKAALEAFFHEQNSSGL